MRLDEDDVERQQIEWEFGLTGGELNDEPWNGFRYHHDGVPDYAAPEFRDRFDTEYRTVVSCFVFGGPPEHIVDADGNWERVAVYASSGEAECPLRSVGEAVIERCPLCDATTDDGEHGYVYLGDGWAEAVFRLDPSDGDSGDEHHFG